MPKSRRKKPSNRGLPATKVTSSSTSSGKYAVVDLLEKANECAEQFQFELACKFCQRALEKEPDNVQALDTYACILLELGNAEEAYNCFSRLIELSPNDGYTKYMYVGQMSAGTDAVKYFNKGIEILKAELTRNEEMGSSNDQSNLIQELSRAFCSLAELYLTDCCFDENAPELCERYCHASIEYNDNNPEAYQILASCLLSQENIEDAQNYMKKSVSLWLPASNEVDHYDNSAATMPSYESRITCAKLLIELEQFESAAEVLDGLLQEDDEVVQVQYLMGWLNCKEHDTAAARQYLELAIKLYEKLQCDDSEMYEHMQQLLSKLPEGDTDHVENNHNDISDDAVDNMETED